MANPSAGKGASHYRYGKCLNDSCKLGGNNPQVQKLSAHQDFVCQECRKPLHDCPPPKQGSGKTAVILGAIGSLAVLTGIGFGVNALFFKEKVEQPQSVVEKPEGAATTVTDTASADTVVKSTPDAKPVASDPVPVKEPVTSASVRCGRYNGPMSGGVPNGIGGTITVTRTYNIDLKDGSGSTVVVGPGDKIVDTKFKDGLLQQGQIIFSDGSRKYISGLAERL